MQDLPIGIFDSGIGGLTVARQIMKLLPHESLIYLGDTARVPYGTRDKQTIIRFAKELTRFMLAKEVKALVVACNTMSGVALDEINKMTDIPVLGVIEPTVNEALESSRTHEIGVIGTRATINSKAYDKEISGKNIKVKLISKACPLFVPLVEEGFIKQNATQLIVNEYLSSFKKTKIDTLILGCTHYPVLKSLIQKAVGKDILLVDSAYPTAIALKNLLSSKNLLTTNMHKPKYRFYVTDSTDRTQNIVNVFFDHKFPGDLEKVEL